MGAALSMAARKAAAAGNEPALLRALGASVGLPGFGPAALALVASTVSRDMEWLLVYGRTRQPEVVLHRVVAEADSGIDRAAPTRSATPSASVTPPIARR